MALEWLSPVVSGVVGLGGLGAGWRLAAGARKHEVAQWHRERRAGAYVELLDVAEDVGDWVAAVFPTWDIDPPQPLPPMPSLERQSRARARVAAFGSPTVKAAMQPWLDTAHAALRAAEDLARDADSARRVLDDARAAEEAAHNELDAAINDDLRK